MHNLLLRDRSSYKTNDLIMEQLGPLPMAYFDFSETWARTSDEISFPK